MKRGKEMSKEMGERWTRLWVEDGRGDRHDEEQ